MRYSQMSESIALTNCTSTRGFPRSKQKSVGLTGSHALSGGSLLLFGLCCRDRARDLLTPFQEQACDLAGDLILRGGHENDVENLLAALMGHWWNRQFHGKGIPKEEEQVQQFIDKQWHHWYRDL